MAALQAELDALKAISRSLLIQFERGSKTSEQLQLLLDATSSLQVAILQPDFRRRSDASRISRDILDLSRLAEDNLEALQHLIHPNRDRRPSRSPRSGAEEKSRNQNIFSNLKKHAHAFQRLSDYITNREDWTRLAPKAPKAPRALSSSPEASSRLQPAEKGKETTSAPISPYQPTVEDVDDTDGEDEVKYNVEHVHYVHKEDSSVIDPAKVEQTHPKRTSHPQTPPQVVIRQATDPKQFEPSSSKVAASSASPLKTAAGVNDVDGAANKAVQDTEVNQTSSLQKRDSHADRPLSKSLQELEDEIARLNRKLQEKYSEGATSTSDAAKPESGKWTSSGKHKSVDLGRTNSLFGDSGSRRPRSSTSQNAERPRSFVEGTAFDPGYKPDMLPPALPEGLRRASSMKSRPSLSRSPRSAPFSPYDPHVDTYWDYGYPHGATNMYGPDPRTSLPTVLESGKRDHRSARTGRIVPKFHFENPMDTFGDFFREEDPGIADFPLFGPSVQPPLNQGRSRGNSRAQNEASPNPKPYISPRQLHESLPIEPDVRQISVSLEDMFYGVKKKFRVKRDKYNPQTGIITQEECIMEVPIPRGLKPKSKIKFEGAGHETREGTRELHFELVEKQHPVFTRSDYDLHCTLEITLVEALCGWEKSITSICGKEVIFSHPGPTPATWHEERAGLGMCTFKDPSIRGYLVASVSIRGA
ncbi:uncharacterized protein PV09_07756 [Verruconis gallopava]|uniref:Chaperone DnaJ C-terminal domain-containing protein n=1 Tax=Verruconis gallopava TaxID=253628 RepID=A0A0D1XEZ1_9PEZI|nr:uncharacterized protein PV09_07756 [Verruconis gallopava]KIW00776.1 hypothetical protein PV09_07756 [Verruconis gallopava]